MAGSQGCPNEPPVLSDLSDRSDSIGANVEIDLAAEDPDGDPVDLIASGLPAGVQLEPDGVLRGVVDPSAIGRHPVIITASDGVESKSTKFVWTIVERELNVGDVAMIEGDSGRLNVMRFAITLSSPAPTDVVAEWTVGGGTATSGSDYRSLRKPGRTVIKAGKTRGFAVVRTFPDHVGEGDETFDVSLQTVSGPAELGDHAEGTGTIIDDDDGSSGSSVSVGDGSAVESRQGETVIAVPFTLSDTLPADVEVTWILTPVSAAAGVDYKELTRPRTTRIRSGRTSGRALIKVFGDHSLEPDETFTVTVVSVRSVDNSNIVEIRRATGIGTIIDGS